MAIQDKLPLAILVPVGTCTYLYGELVPVPTYMVNYRTYGNAGRLTKYSN